MKNIKFVPLVASILLCFAAGGIGSFFTVEAIPTWYATLNKPPFNPPNWIFGPVWSTLYFMMGIALYMVWQKKINEAAKKKALTYFFIQLTLNTFWSIVFFGLQSPLLGFLVVIALWFSIALTIKNFLSISKQAGYLLIPYLAWVSFASFLNFMIMLLN